MDGWITIGTKVDTKNFDKQIQSIERKINDLERILDDADLIGLNEREIEETEIEIEKLKNKLVALNKQKDKLGEKEDISLVDNMKDINKYTESAIKKVGKLVLGVFSIASAYRFASQASSTLAQYDKQYSANLDYIKFALAQGIAPILRYLVNLAGTLLGYLNYILNAWFGINLFSKASAKNFAKSAGSAKEIKKQLAGFDEMNVISDTSSGSAGGGVAMPSMDLSNIQGEVPEWIRWIAEHKDIVLGALTGIAIAVGAIKLAGLINGAGTLINLILKGTAFLSKLIGVVFKFIESLGLVKSIGIVVILAGTVALIQDIIDYLKNPTWEKFGEILTDIGIILAGIALLVGSIPLAIAAAIAVIAGLVITNWEKIKSILISIGDFVYNKIIAPISDGISKFWNWVFTGVSNLVNKVISKVNSIINIVNNVSSIITTIFSKLGTKAGDVFGSTFKAVINAILKTIENMLNTPIKAINGLINTVNKVPGINLSRLSTFKLPRLKVGGIINMPGRGIPIGGAIGGESGAEGVIPLTDSQAMETLGQAIGKYININLTNITKLNNRQIAKEQKRINNQMDFAYNS